MTVIGRRAFSNLQPAGTSLTSIALPDSLTSIGGVHGAGVDRVAARADWDPSSSVQLLHLFLLIGLALLLAFSWFHFVRQSGLLG